jgi:hypothetical protein
MIRPRENQTGKRINKFSGSPRFPFFLKETLPFFPLPLLSVQGNHAGNFQRIFNPVQTGASSESIRGVDTNDREGYSTGYPPTDFLWY